MLYTILAVLPAGAVFFFAYGRYDGAFRDNVVFLYFMGGLIMGFLTGFFSVLALNTLQPLMAVILLAVLYPITLTVGINRRKWQGERHAVFNGGAFALGNALMLGFTVLYARMEPLGIDVQLAVMALAVCGGFAGLFFAIGLLAGDAVRRRKPIRVAILGTAVVLAPILFFHQWWRATGFLRQDASWASVAWIWVVLLLAYGAIVGFAAERKLLILGVTDEARRARRRERRARTE